MHTTSKILFREIQGIRHPLFLALILAANLIWVWAIIQQVILGMPFGNHPSSDISLIIICVVMGTFSILFLQVKLTTEVRSDGVYYKFSLLQPKTRVIPPEEIEKFESVKYRPIREYGGWGIKVRKGNKNHVAYNVSGNLGIKFHLHSGKSILIGTRKPALFHAAVKRMVSKETDLGK